MKDAQEKTEEWQTYETAAIREPTKLPTLAIGTVVRARHDLDPLGANVKSGTVGFVFGETDCYGDGAGPIVRWLPIGQRGVEVGGVCNVYPDDVDILDDHDAEYIRLPTEAIKRLLRHSWTDIDFKYEGLTDSEKKAVSEEDFKFLAGWVRDEGEET